MDVADPPHPASTVRPERDSVEWMQALQGSGPDRDSAVRDLYDMLLGVARSEVRRRSARTGITGPELDDLAHEAAGDATISVLRKLDDFRGESRFTTWAYKFVIFQLSTTIGRRYWRNASTSFDAEDWHRLPDRLLRLPRRPLKRVS